MSIPAASFSRASASVVHSWSLVIPAATYAARAAPARPGAWPSTGLPCRRAAAILASTPGSPFRTPGKFITSPSATTWGWSKNGSRSAAASRAPEVSSAVAGTQEGRVQKRLSGWPAEASRM